jgi:hypothetical protein
LSPHDVDPHEDKVVAMPLFFLTLAFIVSTYTLATSGYVVLRALKLSISGTADRFALALAVGLGSVSWLCAMLGVVVGWTYGIPLLLLIAAICAVLGFGETVRDARELMQAGREWWNEATLIERALIAVVGISVLCYIAISGLPTTLTDDTRSYLLTPRLILRAGELVSVPDDITSYWPMSRQVLSVVANWFWDYRLARLFGVVAAIVLGAVTMALACRLTDRRTAPIALALLLYLPVVHILTPAGKPDVMFVAMIVAALLMLDLLPTLVTPKRGALIFGLLLGVSFTTKITTPFMLPIFLIWGVRTWRVTSTEERPGLSQTAAIIGAIVAGGLLAYVPWALKDLVEFGSPAYFITRMGQSGSFEAQNASMPLATWLMGLVDSVRAPYLLSIARKNSSIIPLFFWVLTIVGLVWNRRREWTWWLVAGALAGIPLEYATLPWFSVRYVLPTFILLAIVAASGLSALLQSRRRWISYGFGGAAAAVVISTILPRLFIGVLSLGTILGLNPQSEWIDRWVDSHEVINWSRTHWTWDSKVYTPGITDQMYFDAHMYYIGSSLPGRKLRYMTTTQDRLAYMDSTGITYLVISPAVKADSSLAELARVGFDTLFVTSDSAHTILQRRDTGVSADTTNAGRSP